MTSKEMITISLWHEKQAEKFERKARALFSQEEKKRANSCKDGPATTELKNIAYSYLLKYFEDNESVTMDYINELKTTSRPCTETLFFKSATFEQNVLFNSDEPYWNMYFASWWFKKNWANLVDEFVEYKINSSDFKVVED